MHWLMMQAVARFKHTGLDGGAVSQLSDAAPALIDQ